MVSRYKMIYSMFETFENAQTLLQKSFRECKLTDLLPDTEYYVDIQACNSMGFGPLTGNPVKVKTEPAPLIKALPPARPAAPTLELVMGEDDKTAVRVNWKCPEKFDPKKGFIYDPDTQTHMILQYSVYFSGGLRNPDEGERVEERTELPQQRDRRTVPWNKYNTIDFSDLIPGRFYHAFVKSFSEAGCSVWSEASEIIRAPPGVPNGVKGLQCTGRANNSLTIEWVCPLGNGEEVDQFFVRLREDRILRGWNKGEPAAPQDSGESAGKYEEVGAWLDELKLNTADILLEPLQAGEVPAGKACRWEFKGLQAASYYSIEIISANMVGRGPHACLEDLRTCSVKPGPTGPATGVSGSATTSGISFAWSAPTFAGGEDILGYEVCWSHLWVGKSVPAEPEAVFSEQMRAELKELDAETRNYRAEGLHPGNAAIPLVRAHNCIGHGPWCRLPLDGAEVVALSALPDVPDELQAPPSLQRTPSIDHKPYAIAAHWSVPGENGRPIQSFKLQLFKADDGWEERLAEGKHEVMLEVSLDAPKDRVWVQGEDLDLANVHVGLEPGAPYAIRVCAVNEVGPAKSWGPPSLREFAPPDYPERPRAPTCPWQWPSALEIKWEEPCMKGAALDRVAMRFSKVSTMTTVIDIPESQVNLDLENKQVKVEDLRGGNAYYFQVRVQNSVGWSDWSPVSEGFRTRACRPARPAMPTKISMSCTNLKVRWELPNDHGASLEKYNVVLVDMEKADELADVLKKADECGSEEEAEAIIQAFQPKEYLTHMAMDAHDATALSREQQEEIVIAFNRFDEDSSGEIDAHELKNCLAYLGVEAKKDEIQKIMFEMDEDGSGSVAYEEFSAMATFKMLKAQEEVFGGLFGGIQYAVAVRVSNCEGHSDWSPVLYDGLRSPTTFPHQCPGLALLEATTNSLRCEFRLPYDSGDRISCMEVTWVRVGGPVDRHLALGGTLQAGRTRRMETQGVVQVDIPEPGLERARPYGYGGKGEATVTGLEPGTEYELQVQACNEHGFGPISHGVRMLCLPGRPDAPSKLQHVNNSAVQNLHARSLVDRISNSPRSPLSPSPRSRSVFKIPQDTPGSGSTLDIKPSSPLPEEA